MTHQPTSKVIDNRKDLVPTIQKQMAPIVDKALSLEINKPEDMVPATELLSRLNQFNDKITAEKERITKPLNEALRVERGRWKPLVDAYENAIAYLRYEMEDYQTKLVLKQKADEAKIAQKLTDGEITLDQAVSKIEKVKVPDKEVATTAGLVQFRETQILNIIDPMEIPREYLIVDDKKLLDDLKAGKVVSGAELGIKLVPINYR